MGGRCGGRGHLKAGSRGCDRGAASAEVAASHIDPLPRPAPGAPVSLPQTETYKPALTKYKTV